MKTAEIKYVRKDDRYDPTERITHVGGDAAGGGKWILTQKDTIDKIESREWGFFVERPKNDRVKVIVAVSRFGNKYIKTEADGDNPNNLLSLPSC